MNRLEYLLDCASEESSEFAVRVSKAMRFGMTEIEPGQGMTNVERFMDELHDQLAVVFILRAEGHIPRSIPIVPDCDRIALKLAKIEKFMALSREQGTLDG